MNKTFRKIWLFCALLCIMVLPVSAYVEIVEQDDSYFVTDAAKVLDSSTEEYIVSKNQVLNATAGASIVIVTVDLLNADIVDYAYSIFNEWELGDAELNNGILLLVSKGDQDYYCMVGRGLETIFPADELQQILDDDLEPDFASGNIQQGIRKVFDTLYQRCVHLYNVNEDAASDINPLDQVFNSVSTLFTILQIALMMFVVITVFVVVLTTTARRRVVHRPAPPPPLVILPPRRTSSWVHHRPSYPASHRPVNRTVVHTPSRSSGFGSTAHRSSTPRSSSSFRPRTGGSSRGAGAGRRR